MKTESLQEYLEGLKRLADENAPSVAVLVPGSEPVCRVDLDSRYIEKPQVVNVTGDHRAETIYFKMPRFHDRVDLATTVGLINYTTPKGNTYFYVIPYYDIVSCVEKDKDGNEIPMMVFPWLLSSKVAEKAGNVRFAMTFYRLTKEGDRFAYILNTTFQNLYIDVNLFDQIHDKESEELNKRVPGEWEQALANAAAAAQEGSLTWIVL